MFTWRGWEGKGGKKMSSDDNDFQLNRDFIAIFYCCHFICTVVVANCPALPGCDSLVGNNHFLPVYSRIAIDLPIQKHFLPIFCPCYLKTERIGHSHHPWTKESASCLLIVITF